MTGDLKSPLSRTGRVIILVDQNPCHLPSSGTYVRGSIGPSCYAVEPTGLGYLLK